MGGATKSKEIMKREDYEILANNLKRRKNTMIIKRIFDNVLSILLLTFFLPFIAIVSILILVDSGRPIYFKQERMGKNGNTFMIYKFRTMRNNTATKDGITLVNDNRITKVGAFLRKYRFDEIPQLFNIIKGEMSFVGPRPDLPKYYMVEDYAYKGVLLVKPGITVDATLYFKDEDKILSTSSDPERSYVEDVFPQKVNLNVNYIKSISLLYDLKIMINTFLSVFLNKK